jgi:hypothetical protein
MLTWHMETQPEMADLQNFITHLAGFWTVAPALSKGDVNPGRGRFMTDEARHYMEIGREFESHDAVNHGEKEYVATSTKSPTRSAPMASLLS